MSGIGGTGHAGHALPGAGRGAGAQDGGGARTAARGAPVAAAGAVSGAVPAVWTGDVLVVVAALVALVPMGFLHVTASAEVDPLGQTVSDYVVVPGGYALLGISAVGLVVAALALAVGARRAGLGRLVPAALVSWAVAMAMAGVFPTNAPGTPADVAAGVHRYAGVWMFAVLPVTALLVARRLHSRPLGWLATATGTLSLAFLLGHVPMVFFGSPGVGFLGLVERILYAMVIVVLVVTARTVRAATDGAATGPVPGPPSARRPASPGEVRA